MSDNLTAYLAPQTLEKDLLQEIGLHPDLKILNQWERLVVVRGPAMNLIFAQNTWFDVQHVSVHSIGETVKALRAHGKLWTPYSHELHRRMSLVQDQLPKMKAKPIAFGTAAFTAPLGAWTLQDANNLWFSSRTSSPFPHGELEFVEDKTAPSRAYLKLWEFFTLHSQRPQANQVCMDLGASPGGWTWVLADMCKKVISVDKAALTPELQKNPKVQVLKKDAFALLPCDIGPIDWLFSDIICYPPKLLELVEIWRASGLVKNFVCTIKFQSETDFETLRKFQAIPGSKTQHLSVNKHEVTWSLLDNNAGN